MADGQADTAPGTLDDLAAFLVDNPDLVDPPDEDAPPTEKPASPRTRAQPEPDTQGAPGDDAAPAPDPEDDDEPEPEPPRKKGDEDEEEEDDPDANDRTRERKYKVTVKGDDGADETLEVTDTELVKGYMRQSDYSRKRAADEAQKTELSQRALGALETARTRHLEQLELYARAFQRHTGLRSPEDMATLARTDPATWVQEQQRERLIADDFQRLQADIQQERAESERTNAARQQQSFAQAWGVLGQHGIDKPKLRKIFDDTAKHFGIPEERLNNIDDPKLVLILQAATKYVDLKARTADATKKAQTAPRLPAQRQTVPRNERLAKQIDARFKGGKAKLDDLAAYIAINKL